MTLDDIVAAARAAGGASSDFDLNPDIVLPPTRKLRDAAVLVGLQEGPGGLRILLTKRSSALKHHPGQIAFPGGKSEPGETPEETALRESSEEVGLPEAVPLCRLPGHETVTSFIMTPVLAQIPAFTPIPEPGEVAEVFAVPAGHVLDPANFVIQSRRWRGQRRFYYTVPWGPYYIWGATARILWGLANAYADYR